MKPYNLGAESAIGSCLLVALILTKNVDKYKYRYSDIGCDVPSSFSLRSGNGFGKNIIISGKSRKLKGQVIFFKNEQKNLHKVFLCRTYTNRVILIVINNFLK